MAKTQNKADEIHNEADHKARVRRNKLGNMLRAIDIEHFTNCDPSLIMVSVSDLEMLLMCRDED